MVTVNPPPLGGAVSVKPASGFGVTTTFDLIQSGWVDRDLPLSFSFTYVEANGGEEESVVADFSGQSHVGTTLSPVGS